ncbi:unnamed protein product [Ostreobium quekettii]|uniref:Uncharacterized protein n=2 Tax=Ostreobium quekettii TaxID=121088 RepID=A0A8S1JHI2_9CHLO|nr:unnamed protein product [Ostreobium quekettii]
MTNPKDSPRVMREGDRSRAGTPSRGLQRTISNASSYYPEPTGFWNSLLNFRGFKNSLKLRKDWKLKEKLYMTVGGDYCFQNYKLTPVVQFTYKFNKQLRVDVTHNTVRFERPCTMQLGEFGLALTPTLKISFKNNSPAVTLDTKLNGLQPARYVVGILAAGVLLGYPLKTTKIVKVPKLSNVATVQPRLRFMLLCFSTSWMVHSFTLVAVMLSCLFFLSPASSYLIGCCAALLGTAVCQSLHFAPCLKEAKHALCLCFLLAHRDFTACFIAWKRV